MRTHCGVWKHIHVLNTMVDIYLCICMQRNRYINLQLLSSSIQFISKVLHTIHHEGPPPHNSSQRSSTFKVFRILWIFLHACVAVYIDVTKVRLLCSRRSSSIIAHTFCSSCHEGPRSLQSPSRFADILNCFHEGHHICGHFELFSRRSHICGHLRTFWIVFTKVVTFADILNFFHEGHHICGHFKLFFTKVITFADILNFFHEGHHICGHFKLFFTKVITFADILNFFSRRSSYLRTF
jgi:hypothetical protein